VGFNFQLNTLTLSPGTHTITAVSTENDASLSGASYAVSVNVVPTAGPPSVFIDSAAPGATVSGIVTIAGWAIDNTSGVGTAINGVQIKVDGVVVGNATYGVQRADVCAAYPRRVGCPNVGFNFQLNAAVLSVGPHTLTAVATDKDANSDSGSYSMLVTVAAPSPPPGIHIDFPAPGATVAGTVTVSGWAIDSTSGIGTAIAGVQVLVDGVAVGNAAYGVNRTDVCAAFPNRAGCPNVGFTFQLNTALLSPGAHTITAIATDKDVNPDMGATSVTVTVAAGVTPPSVVIDLPQPGAPVSGTVTMMGWALDNVAKVGSTISSVLVLVDYLVVGNATYGVFRSDVCAVYPGRAACPNVGFSYALDTSTIASGTHTITVLAANTGGVVGSASVVVKK
jgi:hypothetical protein